MAKRLYMTTADYVTIALSPALIMTLVGSLVFFLIEVMYEGEYQARLMYVFALFVFAAVLVARISIESGTEYASLFALPLGLATFFVLLRFVEHPSPFSWLINIGLMGVVWWCAHKLTWDCTLIDDEEDSSGEGLMQRIGVDEGAENELMAEKDAASSWWRRLLAPKKGKHTPGLWVLYFSLAALPLFGIGQHWVPAAEIGRRRYVFTLLLIYVASALALLVTTSFLGLRRYLRQRRIEMPAPMAANWVAIGAVLIAIVMLLAALIPRPNAEYAISQVPWQATSPGRLSSSRLSAGRDGSAQFDSSGRAIKPDAPQGDAVQEGGQGKPAESDEGKPTGKPGGDGESAGKSSGKSSSDNSQSNSSQSDAAKNEQSSDQSGDQQNAERNSGQASNEQDQSDEDENAEHKRTANTPLPTHSGDKKPFELPKIPQPSLSGLAGLLKLLFYAAVVILAAVFFWRNRRALAQAVRDILRQLRELVARLFGRQPDDSQVSDELFKKADRRPRTFADFRNPFATGEHRRLAPEELVRYTFEAFEAWARDTGHPRSPDQTPAELVRLATEPQTPLREAARHMARLYSAAAYAPGHITPAAAESLRELWSLIEANTSKSVATAGPATN
jgi:Domain of unknown function (DUF4129)